MLKIDPHPVSIVDRSLRYLAVFAAFFLCPTTSTADAPTDSELRCVVTDSSIAVYDVENEVLRYNTLAPKAPDVQRSHYERSGYIHPIRTPAGYVVTGDFAADHPHQHGLFAAWTDTTYRGNQVDFWNQHKGSGIVLHERVQSIETQPGSAGFKVAVKHCALDADGTPTKVLHDVWTVTVTKPANDRYAIDFAISQTNVTDHPLVINEYHYGGIGFRGSNEWYSDGSARALKSYSKEHTKADRPPLAETLHRFTTSQGNNRWSGNHTRPDWLAFSGLLDDKVVTIKASSANSNDRHPHPVRLHPTKPYFSISPCVLGEFTIKPGDTYEASYRFDCVDGEVAP